ncbi:MAG: hypothetical protein M3340_11040 [Actinomycetota bacterium]|nr:hypothetical protein [Actinomycetota bacterium]
MIELQRKGGLRIRATAAAVACALAATCALGLGALDAAPAEAHVSGYCGHDKRVGIHWMTAWSRSRTIRHGDYRYHFHLQIHFHRSDPNGFFHAVHGRWRYCGRQYAGQLT